MKMRMILLLAGLVIFGPGHASASEALSGGEAGGGGKVVVCRGADGSVQSAELLDLWEAKTLYSRSPLPVAGDLAAAVDADLVRLKNAYRFEGGGSIGNEAYNGQDYALAVLRMRAHTFLEPQAKSVKRLRNVTLTPTDDSYEVARPAGCALEQLVIYQDNGFIYVNQDLWEKLDEANLAGLIAHESLYALLRDWANESNSIRTRRAVGLVASGYEFPLTPAASILGKVVCVYEGQGPFQSREDQLALGFEATSDGNTQMNFYLDTLNHSALMGVGAVPAGYLALSPEVGEMLRTGKKCDGLNMETKFTPKGFVEFDREVGIEWTCDNGKMAVALLETPPGAKASLEHTLTCQFQPANQERN